MYVLNVCFALYGLVARLLGWQNQSNCTCFPLCLICMLCFWKIHKYFRDFVGIYFANPHGTPLVHLGGTKGFQRLNAYAKCHHNPYESEL